MLRLFCAACLLLPTLACAQSTPAGRFLEQMRDGYASGTDPLTPSDSVATAVQTISIFWRPQPNELCQLYLYRPALSSQFYLKKMWMQLDGSAGAPPDTVFTQNRLVQLMPYLSARLERLVRHEGGYQLPLHSVHYGPNSFTAPRHPRRETRRAARRATFKFAIRLEQAPPYSHSYRTRLDPEGYKSREIIRHLGYSPWLYYRHQRRAYRRVLRLMHDFIEGPAR